MSDWIEWNGGECPVDRGSFVDVRFRDGQTWLHHAAWKLCCSDDENYWEHIPSEPDDDIIAYRVVPA